MADEDREPTLAELVPTMDGADRMRVLSPDTPAEFREALLDFYRRQWKEEHAPPSSSSEPEPFKPEPQTGPQFDLQALRDEIDRAIKVMGQATELLKHPSGAKPSDEPPNKQPPSRHPVLGVVLGVIGTLILNELHVPLKLTLPLWIALAICIWQWPRIVKTKRRLVSFWIALGFYSLVIVVNLFAFQQKSSTRLDTIATATPSTVTSTAPAVEQRIFIDVDPGYLVGLYQKYNSAQADEAVKTYIGKWLRVSGNVGDVTRQRRLNERGTVSMMISVKRADGFHLYTILADFDDQRWIDRALIFNRGEKVTVIGKLERVIESGIILEKCEIVE
jgi:hypothetical protein